MNGIRMMLSGLAAAVCFSLTAQGTAEDYRRAFHVTERFPGQLVTGAAERTAWKTDRTFSFVRRLPEGPRFFIGTVSDGAEATVRPVNLEAIAAKVSDKLGRPVTPDKLPADRFELQDRGTDRISFETAGWRFTFDKSCDERPRTVSSVAPKPAQPPKTVIEPGPQDAPKYRFWSEVNRHTSSRRTASPKGDLKAYIRRSNVLLCDAKGQNIRPLTKDGTPENRYSDEIAWSPDGTRLALVRVRPPKEVREVTYVRSSPWWQKQPEVIEQEYVKPGDELEHRIPCVAEVATGRLIVPSDELFSKQFWVSAPQWTRDGRAIRFQYNERGHKTVRYLEMDASTGAVRVLSEEKAETFVVYGRIYRHILGSDREMIQSSERDGYNHLYLFDLETGKVKNRITQGPWVVHRVLWVDESGRRVCFEAMGREPGEDPYFKQVYVVGLDGTGLRRLTFGSGNHTVRFNRSCTWMIDTWSRPDCPPETVLRSVATPDRGAVPLGKGDMSRLTAAGWQVPIVFSAPGRDGKTPIWGLIYRPTDFDPAKRYPVIEDIYAGPGDFYTPKNFREGDWFIRRTAELGFVVVKLDGMGTAGRGKAFEDVCYKNLKDAGFPDRIAWMTAAAKKYPWMDISRVGVYGSSAGGQSAMAAVLFHPEFYKAAYAACGCHDNRMDKIWWNEQWMGYPVDQSYAENSNAEQAHRLTRPLMLMVGEVDSNVDPASTMQVVNALVKANKPFELVVLPNVGHSMGEWYGEHKRFDFFVKHLLGAEPPSWYELSRSPAARKAARPE